MLLTASDPTTGLEADGDRLVQLWTWFSTDHNPPAGYFKYGGDLFNSDGDLTAIGDRFASMTGAHYTPYIDLQPVPPIEAVSSTDQFTILAYIQNRGNVTAANASARLILTDYFSQTTLDAQDIALGDMGRRYSQPPISVQNAWPYTPPRRLHGHHYCRSRRPVT